MKSLLSSWVSVRAAASLLVRALFSQPGHAVVVVGLLVGSLEKAIALGPERSEQFFHAFDCILRRPRMKLLFFKNHFHLHLMRLIYDVSSLSLFSSEKECKMIHNEEMRESSVNLSFGGALRNLVQLLWTLFSGTKLESTLLSMARTQLLVPLFLASTLLKRVQVLPPPSLLLLTGETHPCSGCIPRGPGTSPQASVGTPSSSLVEGGSRLSATRPPSFHTGSHRRSHLGSGGSG